MGSGVCALAVPALPLADVAAGDGVASAVRFALSAVGPDALVGWPFGLGVCAFSAASALLDGVTPVEAAAVGVLPLPAVAGAGELAGWLFGLGVWPASGALLSLAVAAVAD